MMEKSFEEQFEQLCLGELSNEEILAFYNQYADQNEARKKIVDELSEQSLIHEQLKGCKREHLTQLESQWSTQVITELLQAKDSKNNAKKSFVDTDHVSTISSETRQIKWSSLVALLCFSLALAWYFSSSTEDKSSTVQQKRIARLTLGTGTQILRNSKPIVYKEGLELFPGDIITTEAVNRCFILFDDGTHIRLNESSRLELNPQTIFLSYGSLRSSIKPQKEQPFSFLTHEIQTEILGTMIHLESRNRRSLLQVFEGEVQATRLSDGISLKLKQGWQVRSEQEFFKASRIPQEKDLREGLIGSWTMSDYKNHYVKDFSGLGNHAKVMGKPQLVENSGLKVMKYNRLFSDNLIVPNHSSINFKAKDDFTFIVRINTHGNQVITLLEKRPQTKPHSPGYVFFLHNGNLGIQLNDALETEPKNIIARQKKVNDGRWHQLIVSVRRSEDPVGVFYVDGKKIKTFNPQTINDLSNQEDLFIGGHTNNPDYYFSGYIDEVHMYNRYFSSPEAMKLYGGE